MGPESALQVDESRREAALKAAFDAHYLALLRLAMLLTGHRETAHDLVQETFVRVLPRLNEGSTESLRAYLRQTMLNTWRSDLRRARIGRRVLQMIRPRVDEITSFEPDPMWDVIARLPNRQRACVVLRYFEDMPLADIASVLGCSVGAVKTHLRRALLHLRKELHDEP